MEPSLHNSVMQQVVERYQAHALVMSHEGVNDSVRLSPRQPFVRIVNRFIKAVATERARSLESSQICHRLACLNHRRKDGSVGCNDDLIA
jgi:hypothetical protein